MIPVYIGYDSTETLAWHVLAHSIIRRASQPVCLTPVGNSTLPRTLWWRERGNFDSTDFSNARFAVPALQNYGGWALFMDSDMVMFEDVAELWAQRDEDCAVMVVKHCHEPKEKTKFLGQVQSTYRRKNWSSLMLFNCAHPACRDLTPKYINSAPGLDLHGFAWAPDEAIGTLKGAWNVLSVDKGKLEHPECA